MEQIIQFTEPPPHVRSQAPPHQSVTQEPYRVNTDFINTRGQSQVRAEGNVKDGTGMLQQTRPASIATKNPYATSMSTAPIPISKPTRKDSSGSTSKSSYPSTTSLPEPSSYFEPQPGVVPSTTDVKTILRSAWSPDSEHRKSFFNKA